MPWQLIYTSAPRGLMPGQSGFCTVAHTARLRPTLIQKLERLSTYHSLSRPGPDGVGVTPVISAYRQLEVLGEKHYVLSRLRDAGMDFSGRSNYLAHHLVFRPDELASLPSPAAILSLWDKWETHWNGDPRLLDDTAMPELAELVQRPFTPALNWQQVAGDRAKARSLLAPPYSQGCYLLTTPGDEDLLLALFAESLHHLNPRGDLASSAWRHPFTTFLQNEDSPQDFHWRGVWESSPGHEKALKSGVLIVEPKAIAAPPPELVPPVSQPAEPLRVTLSGGPVVPAITLSAPPLSQVGARPPAGVAPYPGTGSPVRLRVKPGDLEPSDESERDAEEETDDTDSGEIGWGKVLWLAVIVFLVVVAAAAAGFYLGRSRIHPAQPGAPNPATTESAPANHRASDPATATESPAANREVSPEVLQSLKTLRDWAPGPAYVSFSTSVVDVLKEHLSLQTNLPAKVSAMQTADLQCFLLCTNQIGSWKGSQLKVELRSPELSTAHFRLQFTGQTGRNEPPVKIRAPERPSSDASMTTNPVVALTLQVPAGAAQGDSCLHFVALKANPTNGVPVVSPLDLPKSLLVPDRSGPSRYVDGLRQVLDRIHLAPNLRWTMEPVSSGMETLGLPAGHRLPDGEEINFAGVRRHFESAMRSCTNRLAQVQLQREQEITNWLGDDFKLGLLLSTNWLDGEFNLGFLLQAPPSDTLASYDSYCAAKATGSQSLPAHRHMLDAYLRDLIRTNRFAPDVAITNLPPAGFLNEAWCQRLDQVLVHYGRTAMGTSPISTLMASPTPTSIQARAKRARGSEKLREEQSKLIAEKNELELSLGMIGNLRWEDVAEVRLYIAVTNLADPAKVLFAVFKDSDTKASP